MENLNQPISVQTLVNAPIEKVWNCWTEPLHIMQWNQASDDWHTPKAENDLRAGGKFVYHMKAKESESGFDFSGTYTEIMPHELIAYTIEDGRKVVVRFTKLDGQTRVQELFEA